VLIKKNTDPQVFNRKSIVRFKNLLRYISIFSLVLTILSLSWFLSVILQNNPEEAKDKLANTAVSVINIPSLLYNIPLKIINNFNSDHEVLYINIKPKQYQKIIMSKNNALENHIILDKYKKFINAEVTYVGKTLNAKIRLKGAVASNHLDTPKWSFRMKIEDGSLLEMETFSLQHPKRRSYVTEYLYHLLAEDNGLIVKKFGLVPVNINGVYKGIYNFEEILDSNFTTREFGANKAVIIFDDSINNQEGNTGQDASYYGSVIVPDGSKKYILDDPILKNSFQSAVNLLESYRTGNLKSSEVFDVDKLAKWLALGDILGAWHGFAWGNVKFIFSDKNNNLIPTVWDSTDENNTANHDNYLRYRVFRLNDSYMDPGSAFWKGIFDDNRIVSLYLMYLEKYTDPEFLDNFLINNQNDINNYMDLLNLDYPSMRIQEEIERIRGNSRYIRNAYIHTEQPFNSYFDNFSEGILTLYLKNRKPTPILIHHLLDLSTNKIYKVDNNAILARNLPKNVIPPLRDYHVSEASFIFKVGSDFNDQSFDNFKVVGSVLGTSKLVQVGINNWKLPK
jgi:hypothetical protein